MNQTSNEAELAEICRTLRAINAGLAHQMATILCLLARDTLVITDLAVPSDELEMILIRGCRQRAEKILANLGSDERAH